jgi:hypothetical protein
LSRVTGVPSRSVGIIFFLDSDAGFISAGGTGSALGGMVTAKTVVMKRRGRAVNFILGLVISGIAYRVKMMNKKDQS